MSGQEKCFSTTPFNDPGPTHEVLLQALSCLNEGLFIADGSGTTTYMNAAAEEITGLSSFKSGKGGFSPSSKMVVPEGRRKKKSPLLYLDAPKRSGRKNDRPDGDLAGCFPDKNPGG